jgi:hypothetical protein
MAVTENEVNAAKVRALDALAKLLGQLAELAIIARAEIVKKQNEGAR